MDVVLVRHAIAAERDARRWPDDADRPLTERGRRRFRLAARGLAALVEAPAQLLASPYARTWETALILAEEAGWPAPEPSPALAADRGTDAALALLPGLGDQGPVILVGHEPTMTLLARALAPADAAAIDWFRKGAAARIDFAGAPVAGGGRLRWMHQPAALRALA